MGREKDPFQRRWHFQDRGKREHDEDEYDLDYNFEDDEYEAEDLFDEKGSNVPRSRPAPPLPPFPSTTRNIYPRRPRANRTPRLTQPIPPIPPKRPTQTTRPKRQAYLPDEPQFSSRRSTGSHQRTPQQTRRTDDLPYRAASTKPGPSTPRKRRVWPIFLVGCASGAVSLVLAVAIIVLMTIRSVENSGTTITGLPNEGRAIAGEPEMQTVLLSALSQLTVCDVAGNISLSVDPNPNTTRTTITTKKTVYVTDQKEANQKLRQVSVLVQAQPSGPSQKALTCQKPQATDASVADITPTTTPTATDNTVLTVNVTLPPNQTGKMPTVDITILLPQSIVQSRDPTDTLVTIQDLQGNISVNGVRGVMNIHDLSGDITVQNGILADGSKLQTQGTLTFDGEIWSTANPPNKRASLFFGGEHQINLTLPQATSATLDATSNVRTAKITSDFPIKVESDNGYPTYHGPFNPAIPIEEKTAPVLRLQASSGNIAIHKK